MLKKNRGRLILVLQRLFGLLIVLVAACLFVWNAEGIPLLETTTEPFWVWIGNGFFGMSYVTVLLIWGIVYFLSGNLLFSYSFMEVATLLFGIANKVMLAVRKQYISVAEFKVLSEAADVEVDLATMFHMSWIFSAMGGVLLGGILWRFSRKMKSSAICTLKMRLVRVAMTAVCVGIFVLMYINPPIEVILYESNPFLKTGDIVWLSQSVFNNTSAVTDDISLEEIDMVYNEYEEIVSAQTEEVSHKKPNIIVIMSEAFWDMNYMDNSLEISRNPMEDFYKLQAEGISGEVAVSTYGGGTNTTEFEFLTGLSAGHFAGVSDWYGEFYSNSQESFVSYLKEMGYNTMAFHSYSGNFWSRDTGYENMGFDEFYSQNDFKNRDRWHGYISDMSLVEEVVDRFEERKAEDEDSPVFAFAVSVQNHVYDLKLASQTSAAADRLEITTSVKDDSISEEVRKDVNEYVNGMDKTIEAIGALLDYFREYDEDTMIVFFGDHAPSFATTVCKTDKSMEESDYYKTPYFIWTNYQNDYEPMGDMNISYLSTAMIDYLKWPKPQQYYVNMYLLEKCPVNTNYERTDDIRKYADAIQDSLKISCFVRENFDVKPEALDFWSVENRNG